jgi:methylated-DNA-[protein]-cysteine S-methyltransferase
VTPSQRVIDSPLGPILLSVDTSCRLTGVRLGPRDVPGRGPTRPARRFPGERLLDAVADQLGEYFDGRRTRFEVPVAMEGSPFQRLVWARLQQIPFGYTLSYGQLAAALGRPGAARAVGGANATNPIAIIVPCHRVIGSSGQLTGYGGGLDVKRHLLDLEVGRRGGAGRRVGTG